MPGFGSLATRRLNSPADQKNDRSRPPACDRAAKVHVSEIRTTARKRRQHSLFPKFQQGLLWVSARGAASRQDLATIL